MSIVGAASSISDGRAFVTTSGTRVQLTSTGLISEVTIQAEEDNTGKVVVGGSTVVAALATRRGITLAPGDTVTLQTNNLSNIYIDAMVNTDGVTYTTSGRT